jgi:CRISPR-associated endonuclease/helicase Cas3
MDYSNAALAHSLGSSGKVDYLRDHLKDVARRASDYAGEFDASEEARVAGLLHDLGKYGCLFQKRLKGLERGIDHWSAGAWVALTKYRDQGIAAALAVEGHHIGLKRVDSLGDLDPARLSVNHPLRLRLSDSDVEKLMLLFRNDGLELPSVASESILDWANAYSKPADGQLDVRMLFSALVDADFIETEAHFGAFPDGRKRYRKPGPKMEADRALKVLEKYIDGLARRSTAAASVKDIRVDLRDACQKSAALSPGLFTLTAPTGSGKTLNMLVFALLHAVLHGLHRIIVVIPYLSIIEQTVKEYRKVFAEHFDTDYMIEDHSLAGIRGADSHDEGDPRYQRSLLAENWDAPIIITTSVQFLESLFSNRPPACRKLHRLAKSVILFDEVQTIPGKIAIPTLATLSRLAERYESSIVFATATQPAFSHLDEDVTRLSASGWKPREIVPSELGLFNRTKRTRVNWPDFKVKWEWNQLADRLVELDRVLCIVNLKRHAHSLFDRLREKTTEGLYHLSTNMCPAHRKAVIDGIRLRLENGLPCRLVSTQCVEAGVDLDFPFVYRAFGPLEAIAQAAGRCNRNGMIKSGEVTVFVPSDEGSPQRAYSQAADVARILLEQNSAGGLDLNSPDIFDEYYRILYSFSRPEDQNEELIEAIRRLDFAAVAEKYRVIDNDSINILVPFEPKTFAGLAKEARESGLSRKWIYRARPYSIGIYRPRSGNPIGDFLEPIPVAGSKDSSGDWFIYLEESHYNKDKGLVAPVSQGVWIA